MHGATALRCPRLSLSFAGGLAYVVPIAINALVGGNPVASFFGFALPLFLLGTVQLFLVLYAWRTIREPRLRLVFGALMSLSLPFMLWGFILGGLTGPPGVALGTSAPFAAALVFSWIVVYKRAWLWTRCCTMAAVYAMGAIVLVAGFRHMNVEASVSRCRDLFFGEWVEATDERAGYCRLSDIQRAKNAVHLAHFTIPGLDGWRFSNHETFPVGRDRASERTNSDEDFIGQAYYRGMDSGTTRFRIRDITIVGDDRFVVPFTATLDEDGETEEVTYVLAFGLDGPAPFGQGGFRDAYRIDGETILSIARRDDEAVAVRIARGDGTTEELTLPIAGNASP